MKASKKLSITQRKHNWGYYMDDKRLGLFKGTFEQWLKVTYQDLSKLVKI